jgi:hypothetical protein
MLRCSFGESRVPIHGLQPNQAVRPHHPVRQTLSGQGFGYQLEKRLMKE